MLFVLTIDYGNKHWPVVFGRPGKRRVTGASRVFFHSVAAAEVQ